MNVEFRPEYFEHARQLVLFGFGDDEVARFFGVDLNGLGLWAMAHEQFYDAITPTDSERRKYQQERDARREAINRGKRARLAKSKSARVRNAISARVWAAIRGRSDGRLFSRLGYSVEDLVRHLETRFQPGMSWQNFGKWHVDHIKPCALFNHQDEAQFRECWSLTNLQPLWAADNIRKGARYAST